MSQEKDLEFLLQHNAAVGGLRLFVFFKFVKQRYMFK